jgi:hypothetical protein
LEAFVHNAYVHQSGVEDFVAGFGDEDEDALREYLVELESSKKPAANYLHGYEANVVACKAHEAILGNKRIEIDDALFNLS